MIFHWDAINSVTGFVYPSYDENSPTYDFSNNTNEDLITITITSNDGFIGFLEMSLYDIGSPELNDVQSKVTDFDLSNAINIERFYPNQSSLRSLDISKNPKLLCFEPSPPRCSKLSGIGGKERSWYYYYYYYGPPKHHCERSSSRFLELHF